MSAWSTYFSTLAESAATLAGLLFVAVSINLEKMIAISGLAERALASLVMLIAMLVISALGLIPQPAPAYGIELVVLGVALFAIGSRLRKGIVESESIQYSPIPRWARAIILVSLTVPLVIGGTLEIFGVPGALFWLVLPMIGTLVISVFNAWVFIVEIIR